MTIVYAHRRSESDPWVFSAEAEALIRRGYRLILPACVAFESEHDKARIEHAWRLEQEGVGTEDIARFLGTSIQRAKWWPKTYVRLQRDYAVRADPQYAAARREHAWRLRQMGETFKAIGWQLDVTPQRARQIVSKFERMRCPVPS